MKHHRRRRGQCWRDDVNDSLKSSGFRMTHPRKILFDFLNERLEFSSAEDIFHEIQSDHPGIGLATIYRTLNLLTEMGFVETLETGDKTLFKLKTEEEGTSVYVICEECRTVIDFKDMTESEKTQIEDFQKRVETETEYTIVRKSIHLWGKCKNCQ